VARALAAVLVAGLLASVSGGAARAQEPELSAGDPLPTVDASLKRVDDGTAVRPNRLTGEAGTVVVFWSNRCPWVDRYEGRLMRMAKEFQGKGVAFVLVNANDGAADPRESLQASRERARAAGYDVPYVRDETGAFARAVGAKRTPHAFVFGPDNRLVYAGAVDDSPADADGVTEPHLRNALEALVAGRTPPTTTTRAFGCMIRLPDEDGADRP
jgi:thiol-disulfide isomerase/thioredoxin